MAEHGKKGVDPDWWKTIFDEVYLLTDARSVCDSRLTRLEADLMARYLDAGRSDPVLDLCGGQGRHSRELAARGYSGLVTLDYSPTLLALGAAESDEAVRFVRADARAIPFAPKSFRAVVMMACSFGYFADDTQNQAILREALRVLSPGGQLLLDIADGEKEIAEISETSWHEADDDTLVLRRRNPCNGGMEVQELVLSRKRGLVREAAYFEKLYTEERIGEMLSSCGYSGIETLRNFESPADGDDLGFMSSRMLVTARRPA